MFLLPTPTAMQPASLTAVFSSRSRKSQQQANQATLVIDMNGPERRRRDSLGWKQERKGPHECLLKPSSLSLREETANRYCYGASLDCYPTLVTEGFLGQHGNDHILRFFTYMSYWHTRSKNNVLSFEQIPIYWICRATFICQQSADRSHRQEN